MKKMVKMETGDLSLNELMNQYNSIEKTGEITTSAPEVIGGTKPWYVTYMLYIALFIWTIVFVVVGRPGIMYVTDPETNEKKLKFSRVVLTIVVVFGSLSVVVFGVTYFKSRQ